MKPEIFIIRAWTLFAHAIVPVIVIALAGIRVYDYYTFINKGARFTALDGQLLCHRVQRLELDVFRKSTLCDFLSPSTNRSSGYEASIDEVAEQQRIINDARIKFDGPYIPRAAE